MGKMKRMPANPILIDLRDALSILDVEAPAYPSIAAIDRILSTRVPIVDAEPVRHGEWVESKGAIRCSECASTPLYDYHGRIVMSKACPNCGAIMDGGSDG